jgi:hypothetical protein
MRNISTLRVKVDVALAAAVLLPHRPVNFRPVSTHASPLAERTPPRCVRCDAPIALHSPLPAADQRQGGALHLIGFAGVGIWHRLHPATTTRADARALAPSIQLAPSASRYCRHGTDQSLRLVPKEPVDASQRARSETINTMCQISLSENGGRDPLIDALNLATSTAIASPFAMFDRRSAGGTRANLSSPSPS